MPVGDLTERRLAHYVGGTWRAPLSDRLIPAAGGPVVAAGPADAARAFRLTRPGVAPVLPDPAAFWPAIAAAATAEGAVAGPCPVQPPPIGRGDGRVLLLPAPDRGAAGMVTDTFAALSAGAGVVLMSPPGLALSAMAVTGAMHDADLPAGRFAMLHGDDESRAALAALPFDRVGPDT